jgi:hypothetical protein
MKHNLTNPVRYLRVFLWVGLGLTFFTPRVSAAQEPVEKLRAEVAGKGWLLFSAKSGGEDYHLFLARPDGSAKRNLPRTPEWNEYGGRFSPDGKKMLYRRMPKSKEGINHDSWGAMGTLVLANADGSEPRAMGKDGEWPWASWSPDGRQLACLYKREGKIRILEIGTGKIVKEMPRQGVFQQMFWSPDGRRLCGTANLNGQDWNIVSLEIDTGKATQVSRNLCCTADWFQHNPTRVIYSCRVPGVGTDYGWTMLMQGTADGKNRALIYGQQGRHLYYGCTSPDDTYAVFSIPESDGGTDAEMVIIRLADAPIIVPGEYEQLKTLYAGSKTGPALHLKQAGFEPHWTYAEIGGK